MAIFSCLKWPEMRAVTLKLIERMHEGHARGPEPPAPGSFGRGHANTISKPRVARFAGMSLMRRTLLAPAVLVTLSLVIANAISISVRERRMEIAVLKVLGFRPGHVLGLILGEAVLIGALSGVASAGAAYLIIDKWFGGIAFPIAFFQKFMIPVDAVWWGLAVGTLTAFAGAIGPAWSARSVKVADVFAKVA